MRYQPSLQTDRLRLRPFVADDAETLVKLCGSSEITATNLTTVATNSTTAAKTWIAGLPHRYRNGSAIHFAVCLLETKQLIGTFALQNIDMQNANAELEFWIIRSFQRQGYAGEALREVLRFAFNQRELHRLFTYYMANDCPTANFLTKHGFQQEGILRDAVKIAGSFKDIALASFLAER
jgi:RimJ/RimL family protein N-acetyltransferase